MNMPEDSYALADFRQIHTYLEIPVFAGKSSRLRSGERA